MDVRELSKIETEELFEREFRLNNYGDIRLGFEYDGAISGEILSRGKYSSKKIMITSRNALVSELVIRILHKRS